MRRMKTRRCNMEDAGDFLNRQSTFLRHGIMIPRSFTFDFVLILNHTQMKDLYIIYFGDDGFSNSQPFLLLYLIAASGLILGILGEFKMT